MSRKDPKFPKLVTGEDEERINPPFRFGVERTHGVFSKDSSSKLSVEIPKTVISSERYVTPKPTRKLKIIANSDCISGKVIDVETGELIEGIAEVDISLRSAELPVAIIKMIGMEVEVERPKVRFVRFEKEE